MLAFALAVERLWPHRRKGPRIWPQCEGTFDLKFAAFVFHCELVPPHAHLGEAGFGLSMTV